MRVHIKYMHINETCVSIFNYWEETEQNIAVALRDEAMDHFHPFFYFCVRFQSIFKFKRMLLKNSTGIIKSLSRDVCLTKRFCV